MKQLVILCLIFGTVRCAMGQDPWKNIYVESAWQERDQWQRADDIMDQLGLGPGSAVADVGCHEGYMTIKLAARVGPVGKVYAVDVQSYRLDELKSHLKERRITNVTTIKGEADDPKLPSGLDAILILDTYHEMREHDLILAHLKHALKAGGRLVICEPIARERRGLSRSQQEQKHELDMQFALQDLKNAGFKIILSKDPYIDRTKIKGDQLWLIVASI